MHLQIGKLGHYGIFLNKQKLLVLTESVMLLNDPLEYLKMVFAEIAIHPNNLEDTTDVVNTDNKKINQIMLKYDGRKGENFRTKMEE